MDEPKKPAGRPQIYQGWQPEQRGRRKTKPSQRPQEEKRKGEYRPLAVTEQQVLSPLPEETMRAGKIETDQKLVRIPKTDLKKVTQIPVRQTEQGTVQRMKQNPESRMPQQMKQNPEPRMPQQMKQNPEQQMEQRKTTAAKRRREQESEMKMRFLWVALSLLSIALVAAIFYEIILGHGIKETGAERMEEQKQELLTDTEANNIEILTPGGELVSEIKERENKRSLSQQKDTEAQSETEGQTDTGENSMQ